MKPYKKSQVTLLGSKLVDLVFVDCMELERVQAIGFDVGTHLHEYDHDVNHIASDLMEISLLGNSIRSTHMVMRKDKTSAYCHIEMIDGTGYLLVLQRVLSYLEWCEASFAESSSVVIKKKSLIDLVISNWIDDISERTQN